MVRVGRHRGAHRAFAGQFDIVGGLEARGFLFAGAISAMTGVGILPIRKAGKLPRPAAAVSYTLEYGTATIEGPDVLKKGERVLLIDDILATGGTLTAAQSLVADLGAEVIGSAVVLELTALGGREHTGEVQLSRSRRLSPHRSAPTIGMSLRLSDRCRREFAADPGASGLRM